MSLGAAPELVVLNKVDRVSDDVLIPLKNELPGIAVSATKKIGIGELLGEIDRCLPRLQPYAPADESVTKNQW
jgi:50S ribosomal subunit-associated GTPase HflX